MGFLDRLRKAFSGQPSTPEAHGQWIYVQCARCGEPLRTRIDLRNDPSEDEDGTYIVRKGLVGGARRCFQSVEVTLRYNPEKSEVVDREISGGRFITAEEYQTLLEQPPQQEQEDDA